MFGKFGAAHAWRYVEVGMKNNLYQFSEGQTHFGMPRGATLSLALNEPK